MIEFSDIYKAIKDNDIKLYQYDIGNMKSATIELSGKYAIFADISRIGSIKEAKRALAHEIGHCATGATHKVCSPLDLVGQHEYKANRWAVERFLPFDELQQAMKDGYTELWQLAEYFNISERAIRWALHYYTENRGMSFNEAS
jgi:Zn-dependent peptidase ImmA (M78 family)